jgi:hypothetical protein
VETSFRLVNQDAILVWIKYGSDLLSCLANQVAGFFDKLPGAAERAHSSRANWIPLARYGRDPGLDEDRF